VVGKGRGEGTQKQGAHADGSACVEENFALAEEFLMHDDLPISGGGGDDDGGARRGARRGNRDNEKGRSAADSDKDDDASDEDDKGGGDGGGDSDGDNEGNEQEKKTFDFYLTKNRGRTAVARQKIKDMLGQIKKVEGRAPPNTEVIANLRAKDLELLKTGLSEACRDYKLQTRYYQAGNFNTMPLCWWGKSNKAADWHHDGGYYYQPNKHAQFVKAVQAAQMLDATNDDFFETYEVECAKWYASWARYGDEKEIGTLNSWTNDSYNNLPDTNNQEDTFMVLKRLSSDFFPALCDNATQKPHSRKPKRVFVCCSSAGGASNKKQRVPKDLAGADEAQDAEDAAKRTPKKKKQASGWSKKLKKRARLAAAALASKENAASSIQQ